MPRKGTIQLNIQLRLSEDVYAKLKGLTGVDDADSRITAWCKWLLEAYAHGGMMLTAQHLATIEETTGAEISDTKALIKAFQASEGREDGQYTVKFNLDPVYHEPAQQNAEMRGMSVQEILKELTQMAVSEGWISNWVPDCKKTPWTDDGAAEMKTLLGKGDFNETDLLEFARNAVAIQ